MYKIEYLVTSGKVILYKKFFEDFSQFYACFHDGYNKQHIIGCGKGVSKKRNALSAIGELVERFAFYHLDADISGVRCNDLDTPFVDPELYQYFSNIQLSSGLVPYERWDPTDIQKWTKMQDINNNNCYFPFEAFKCDRRYIRPTTSGWSVHEDARANVSSALECVERHVIQKYWLLGGYAEKIVINDHDVIKFLKSVGFSTTIYLIDSFSGMYVILVEVSTIGKNKYRLPSRSKFYSSTCSLSLLDAVEDSLAGAIQKLQWIVDYFSRPTQLQFDRNPSLFHRMYTLIHGGDREFEDNLAKIDVIRELDDFDNSCSDDPCRRLMDVDTILRKNGYYLFQKTYNLSEQLCCDLFAVKSTVIGFIQGMFGSDIQLPLFNIQDEYLNDIYTANDRYHPFT
jgi:hypothetical protein